MRTTYIQNSLLRILWIVIQGLIVALTFYFALVCAQSCRFQKYYEQHKAEIEEAIRSELE